MDRNDLGEGAQVRAYISERREGGRKVWSGRPLIGIETISRRFGSRNFDGVNVISPKLTILPGGNEAIQWMGRRGWAEFRPSLTIIRCCLHSFFPLCVLICFHRFHSNTNRVKRVYLLDRRHVNRSKIDRVAKYRNFPRKINYHGHRFSVNSFVRLNNFV